MEYEILGSLRLGVGGERTTIAARKVGTLLAVLITRADEVVTMDELVFELWGSKPPRRPTAAVYVYMSELRKLLREHGATADAIDTRSHGYLLRADAEQIDVRRVQAHVTSGRAQMRAGRADDALAHFDAALSSWKGPVLCDLVDSPALAAFANWAEQLRLDVQELQIDAALSLGRHHEMIGRLGVLTEEHPLREAFCRQHMLALYRAERQAEALSAYNRLRSRLAEELGLEPCRSLRALQQAILSADPRLDEVAA